MSPNDVKILVSDNAAVLWRVIGLPDAWWPTKMVAEMAARAAFPKDPDPTGRVYYSTFYRDV